MPIRFLLIYVVFFSIQAMASEPQTCSNAIHAQNPEATLRLRFDQTASMMEDDPSRNWSWAAGWLEMRLEDLIAFKPFYLHLEIRHFVRHGEWVGPDNCQAILGIEWAQLVSSGPFRASRQGISLGVFESAYHHVVALEEEISLRLTRMRGELSIQELAALESSTPWEVPIRKSNASYYERYQQLFGKYRTKKQQQVARDIIKWAIEKGDWPPMMGVPKILGIDKNMLCGWDAFNPSTGKKGYRHIFPGSQPIIDAVNTLREKRLGNATAPYPQFHIQALKQLGSFSPLPGHQEDSDRLERLRSKRQRQAAEKLVAYLEETGKIPPIQDLFSITGFSFEKLTSLARYSVRSERSLESYHVYPSQKAFKNAWTQLREERIAELENATNQTDSQNKRLRNLLAAKPCNTFCGLCCPRARVLSK